MQWNVASEECQPVQIGGRVRNGNPDHHIWNNNGTYFLHVTLRWNGQRKLRLRKSLGTKDVQEARRRRDRLLARMEERPEIELLIR